MNVALTPANERDLKALLATGRWGNTSEIIRYGIHLVKREVRREDYAPISKADLAKCYAARTPEEKAEDEAWERASLEASRKMTKKEAFA